uniref:ATHSFA2 n=1 Tax=Arundo donax TaxID=35708 RepID=A0A0A8ZC33_ARUDO
MLHGCAAIGGPCRNVSLRHKCSLHTVLQWHIDGSVFSFHQPLPFCSATTQLFLLCIVEQDLLHENWVAEYLCEEGNGLLLVPFIL